MGTLKIIAVILGLGVSFMICMLVTVLIVYALGLSHSILAVPVVILAIMGFVYLTELIGLR